MYLVENGEENQKSFVVLTYKRKPGGESGTSSVQMHKLRSECKGLSRVSSEKNRTPGRESVPSVVGTKH
jgi:hypothetical protein